MNKKIILTLVLLTFALVGIGVYYSLPQPGQINAQEATFASLSPQDFENDIQQKDTTVIDIRTKDEFASGHIANALQSDFYQTTQFSTYLDGLDKKKKYLIYCHSGRRSGLAKTIMQQKGFTNVADLQGGINTWTQAGLPLSTN